LDSIFKDYYRTLDVEKTASADEIKKNYRRLARTWRPDTNPGDKDAEERLKEVTEADELLGDSETRTRYDSLDADRRTYRGSQAGDCDDWVSRYARQQHGQRGARGYTCSAEAEDVLENLGVFSDFLAAFFGRGSVGGARPRRGEPQRDSDFEASLHISREEAVKGCEQTVLIDSKTVRMRIRPGTPSGQRLRLHQQRAPSGAGGRPGDLFVTIHIDKHPFYEQRDNNLVFTAIRGGKIRLCTPEGKRIAVTIPPESDNAVTLRIPAVGLRKDAGETRGDLLVRVSVRLPKKPFRRGTPPSGAVGGYSEEIIIGPSSKWHTAEM
jgi:curved DNA-binding protein